MSRDPERRLSTGGLPPVKVSRKHVVEKAPSHDSTPCFTAWLRDEIMEVPHGWSASEFTIADKRPQRSLQIYDTTPQAADAKHLQTLAKAFHEELCKDHGVGGRDKTARIDVWGLPLATDVSEEERIAKCKAHLLAEIAARENSGDDNCYISELSGHDQWSRSIIIIGRPEGSWDEDEGGFLAVYWDRHSQYQEMLVHAYGPDHQQPDVRVLRHTREELGTLLEDLTNFI
ncbi:hypothetical protein OPT61_g584 [Boeremia exigua]|uniref:Uncharacterized protein n=1 Tax=Boeremia exigua TaxID=749465 RepID=A0ACC2ITE6_9PLEO|nr:hypothetical protein OPT61_g584 [Boeremia exigua]